MISWMLEVDDVACPVGAMKKSDCSDGLRIREGRENKGSGVLTDKRTRGSTMQTAQGCVVSTCQPVHAHALVTTRS